MKHVTNFPLYNGCLEHYGNMAGLISDCKEVGLDGCEFIWDHMPYTEELPPTDIAIGYHMLFYAHWLAFWRRDEEELMREYGSWDMVRDYYHGEEPADMVAHYKADLQHAVDLDAEYLVFHVSDVAIPECFTYQFAHSDEEVVDAAAELINQILDGMDTKMAFLMENQWWPGLKLTDPAIAQRLFERVEYPNKGFMLDTGHLLHTNTKLRTQAEAADYIRETYRNLGPLGEHVRGLHLQQSLTGEYVEGRGYKMPDDFPEDYWEQFTVCYNHIVQIDKHQPWTDPAIASVVDEIAPEWVNHELSGWPRDVHKEAVATQMRTLGLL